MLEDTITQPVITELAPSPWEPCDGHESSAIQALVVILLPTGGQLFLCGHCARASFQYAGFGYHAQENKQEGSDH